MDLEQTGAQRGQSLAICRPTGGLHDGPGAVLPSCAIRRTARVGEWGSVCFNCRLQWHGPEAAAETAPLHDRLPRQRDLARAWQTTLPTVRQALEQLQRDGLLRVEHGVGTFVADLDRAYDPFAVASFTDALRERGLEVETRLVSVETRARSTDAAAALGTRDRDELVVLTRLRRIGGTPIVYQRSYAAGRHRSSLARYDGSIPLYTFLRDRVGLLAASYRETITAEPTPVTVADILGMSAGAPILVSRWTTATAHGDPFLYDEAHLPTDRMRVTITRQGARCTVELSPILAALDAAL